MIINEDESKFDLDFNLFKDPISFEYFKNPKILECGNTLDHEILSGIKKENKNFKCPLCNTIIKYNKIDDIPNNWLICNLLNIEIKKENIDEKKDYYSKKNLNLIASNIIDKEIETIFNDLLVKISLTASNGYFTYRYQPNKLFEKYPIEQFYYLDIALKNKFKALGFKINHDYNTYSGISCCCFSCCGSYITEIIISW